MVMTAIHCHGALAQTATIPVGGTVFQGINSADGTNMSSQSVGAESDGYVTTSAYYTGGEGYVSASISGGNGGVYGLEQGKSILTSGFEVIGPPGAVARVPLIVTASGSVQISTSLDNPAIDDTGGVVILEVGSAPGGSDLFSEDYQIGGPRTAPYTGFGGSVALPLLTPNTYYYITIATQVNGVSQAASGPEVTAMVDPSVDFAPGFDSTGYTLGFSPDLTPVPLPASAWLLLSGLAAFGFFRFKQPRNRTEPMCLA